MAFGNNRNLLGDSEMYKIHKPFIILVILLLPSWAMAFTYTSDQVNISRLLPNSYSQKPTMPVGGWTSSTPVYSFAGEAQVIPPSGGDVLKKVLPLSLSYGKAMPWLALSFTAGYMVGDYIYDNWLSSKGYSIDPQTGGYQSQFPIYDHAHPLTFHVGDQFYENYGSPDIGLVTLMGFYSSSTDAQAAAGEGATGALNAEFYSGDNGVTWSDVYFEAYTNKVIIQYYMQSNPNRAWCFGISPLITLYDYAPIDDSAVWSDFESDASTMAELPQLVENQVEKIAPEYNAYQTAGIQPSEATETQIIALEDALSDDLTLDDTVPVDDADYISTLESINSAPDFSELISALAELDHTNDDKNTPEEIAEGVDASQLKTEVTELSDFIQEEPEAGLTDYSESDLPEHLQNLTPDSSTAYAWFLSKVADIRSAIDSKITTNFSGSCLVYFDFGRFGETTVSACEYQDHLALMGNFLVGITALMGFITVLRG